MLTVLLSHERSGSHLLSELVRASGVITYDEVCNPHAMPPETQPASFHRFRHDWQISHPEFLRAPDPVSQLRFNEAYFRHLIELAAPHPVTIDMKYGHLHNFNETWCPPLARPTFFASCEYTGTKILHLHRTNKLEAVVSAKLAHRRQYYHSWQNSDGQPFEPEELDCKEIVGETILLMEQSKLVSERWLSGVAHLSITYEDLTHAVKSVDNNFQLKVASFLGGTFGGPLTPKHQKIGRGLRQDVSNYSELVSACRGTVLEEFCDC